MMYRFGKFLTKNKCLAVVCLLLLLVSWNGHRGTGVWAGCRQQLDKCGPICVFNEETRQFDCNLRSVLILPNTTNVEASLNKMTIVWRLAWQKIEQMKLLPSNLNVTWKAYDDRCDASYALISAMDGHFKDCADVIFGPICDYALASVSRIAKYFKSEGTPVITTGGNSHDFSVPKNTCDDEYYMLVRTGMISYKTIAEFTIEIMQKYNWTKLAYLYEKNGQYEVAGLHTCHLLMNALAKYHRENNITISSFSAVKFQNMTEILMREVGNQRSGKSN